MNDDASQLHNLDPRLRRAFIHPARRQILGHLMQKRNGSATSERELAETFGMALPLVEYHLWVLQDADLVAHLDDAPEGEGLRRPLLRGGGRHLMLMIGTGTGESRRSTRGRGSGLIDAKARGFLVDRFASLRDDLLEQEQEGGPSSPDQEKSRREVAIYQALLDALEDRGPFPDDRVTRRLILRLADVADEENNYEQAALEHRSYRELLGSLPTP